MYISGESDPFVRTSVCNQSVTSEIIENTVNPIWNQYLKIPSIVFYGDIDWILKNPPEIVLDIFDKDEFQVFVHFSFIYFE